MWSRPPTPIRLGVRRCGPIPQPANARSGPLSGSGPNEVCFSLFSILNRLLGQDNIPCRTLGFHSQQTPVVREKGGNTHWGCFLLERTLRVGRRNFSRAEGMAAVWVSQEPSGACRARGLLLGLHHHHSRQTECRVPLVFGGKDTAAKLKMTIAGVTHIKGMPVTPGSGMEVMAAVPEEMDSNFRSR